MPYAVIVVKGCFSSYSATGKYITKQSINDQNNNLVSKKAKIQMQLIMERDRKKMMCSSGMTLLREPWSQL